MKKTVSILLSLALCAGAVPALAAEAFPAVNAYPGFADVPAGSWYADTVKLCYEVGLMTGKDTGFDPAGTMTLAEASAIAARIQEAVSGVPIPQQEAGEAWYQQYVDYLLPLAEQAGDAFVWDSLTGIADSPAHPAHRLEFAALLALVTPEASLTPINDVKALPDLDYPGILPLYNAGILTGVNDYGTFRADGTLSRAECAAMAARIARPALRQSFTPKTPEPFSDVFDKVQYLLGVDGSTPYFTSNGVTVTAAVFLDHAIELTDQLYHACEEQGFTFSWDNTSNDQDFRSLVFSNANYAALKEAWSQSPDPVALSEAQGVLKARHILIEEKAAAEVFYAQLQADPSQFAALQAAHSEDGRDDSGNLYATEYVFGPGEMVPEFEDETKALALNGIGLVQSSYGWHIIQRMPLTEEDAWSGFINRASVTFSPDFPNGMDLDTAYGGWRNLLYGS